MAQLIQVRTIFGKLNPHLVVAYANEGTAVFSESFSSFIVCRSCWLGNNIWIEFEYSTGLGHMKPMQRGKQNDFCGEDSAVF